MKVTKKHKTSANYLIDGGTIVCLFENQRKHSSCRPGPHEHNQ